VNACDVCHEPTRAEPFDSELLCAKCRQWVWEWRSLTNAQRGVEIRSMDLYTTYQLGENHD
jgi:hypothetical protein